MDHIYEHAEVARFIKGHTWFLGRGGGQRGGGRGGRGGGGNEISQTVAVQQMVECLNNLSITSSTKQNQQVSSFVVCNWILGWYIQISSEISGWSQENTLTV